MVTIALWILVLFIIIFGVLSWTTPRKLRLQTSRLPTSKSVRFNERLNQYHYF